MTYNPTDEYTPPTRTTYDLTTLCGRMQAVLDGMEICCEFPDGSGRRVRRSGGSIVRSVLHSRGATPSKWVAATAYDLDSSSSATSTWTVGLSTLELAQRAFPNAEAICRAYGALKDHHVVYASTKGGCSLVAAYGATDPQAEHRLRVCLKAIITDEGL